MEWLNLLGAFVAFMRLLCVQGLTDPFTEAPRNPTYVSADSVAELKWNYLIYGSFAQVDIMYKSTSNFKLIITKEKSGKVVRNGVQSRFNIKGNATLAISAVTAGDSGTYRCDLFRTSVDYGSLVKLIVTDTPVFTTAPPSSKTINENEELRMQCVSSGNPMPNVTWVQVLDRGGNVVKSQGTGSATLTELNIKRPHGSSGKYLYECQAKNNPNEKPVTKQTEVIVHYKAQIKRAGFSPSNSSWIGQTVTLKCESDGLPVPTITLTGPKNNQIKQETKITSETSVSLTSDDDFGEYKCTANNGFSPESVVTIKLTQIHKPGAPKVTFSDDDIKASSLFVRWNPPDDDGGSPVIGYRVRIVESDFNETFTKQVKEATVSPLTKNTSYTLEVYARNAAGEGPADKKNFRTKYEGPPEAVIVEYVPAEDPRIFTLTWTEPINNGAAITKYVIYKRMIGTNKWITEHTLTEKDLSFNISLSYGTSYQVVVTATNEFGESVKENWVKIDVVPAPTEATQTATTTELATAAKETRVNEKSGSGMIIGVAVGAVLFAIIAVALGFMLWRKRSHQAGKGHGSVSSRDALSADDEAYASVNRRAAVQNLGAGGEVAYADVGGDSSFYAQVDKSKKKPKKPKRKPGEPGELVYADLADFSRPRGGAVPVRPEEIQRSDYADITQFSAPKQEPTYDNLPRADATYANVQAC